MPNPRGKTTGPRGTSLRHECQDAPRTPTRQLQDNYRTITGQSTGQSTRQSPFAKKTHIRTYNKTNLYLISSSPCRKLSILLRKRDCRVDCPVDCPVIVL